MAEKILRPTTNPYTLKRRELDARERSPGLIEAIRAAGGILALGRITGVNKSGVSRWRRVPVEHAAAIERATGVPRATLRPEVFGDV